MCYRNWTFFIRQIFIFHLLKYIQTQNKSILYKTVVGKPVVVHHGGFGDHGPPSTSIKLKYTSTRELQVYKKTSFIVTSCRRLFD